MTVEQIKQISTNVISTIEGELVKNQLTTSDFVVIAKIISDHAQKVDRE